MVGGANKWVGMPKVYTWLTKEAVLVVSYIEPTDFRAPAFLKYPRSVPSKQHRHFLQKSTIVGDVLPKGQVNVAWL